MRPLVVFGSIAATLVLWLSTRMWLGSELWVWRVSCLLGAWAPLGAAAVCLYVKETGHRESGVLAAWCVRAIGMHCVLVWLLGISDWLRGPPHTLPHWNSDAGMPLVFLAFVPAFALSLAALLWSSSVAARLAAYADARRAGALRLVDAAPSPYRDAASELRRVLPSPARPSPAPVVVGAAALGAVAPALSTSLSDLHRAMLWPVAALAALALCLVLLEARLRLVRVIAH